ncbi:MAG: hypothetical protein R3Y53_06450, partial [Bacillota bacterium]
MKKLLLGILIGLLLLFGTVSGVYAYETPIPDLLYVGLESVGKNVSSMKINETTLRVGVVKDDTFISHGELTSNSAFQATVGTNTYVGLDGTYAHAEAQTLTNQL